MIKRALLSVSDKTGLTEFAQFLSDLGIEILSTGGTAKSLRDAGIKVTDVSEATGFPEMMDGRVKTLHPVIHGGLLGRRGLDAHMQAMREHNIQPIDLVAVNLYPFEETLAKGGDKETCIENIDIGGPAMIRSASKNYTSVTVLTDPADYASVMEELKANHGATSLNLREKLAYKAYARTAAYDAAISSWFARELGERLPEQLTLTAQKIATLHYGENPHQQAAFYRTNPSIPSLATATQLQGAALSYNNVNDTDAALNCVAEFKEPAVVIVKHANPCGVATGKTLADAYGRAFACDTVSAYGGIIAVNREVDVAFAEVIAKLFVEVLIAPGVHQDALPLLAAKKKLRLLTIASMPDAARPRMVVKTVQGGLLYQQEDVATFDEKQLKIVTQKQPDAQAMQDLKFAFTLAKHVKSNAIVLAKNAASIGIGAGQMSRIDSTNIAVSKAASMGLSTQGAVLASDAFFPFPDNVELAAKHGISAIIQPGGSIRDDEVIKAADEAGIAMVFTGMRHFRH